VHALTRSLAKQSRLLLIAMGGCLVYCPMRVTIACIKIIQARQLLADRFGYVSGTEI